MNYQDINAQTIDRWIQEGWEWGIPISHEEYEKARAGEWNMLLTPTKFVPHHWFGELKGKKSLALLPVVVSRCRFLPLWEQSVPCWITLKSNWKVNGWWLPGRGIPLKLSVRI